MTPSRSSPRFDLMVALEAVYALETSPQRWLGRLVDTLSPMFDFGEGGCGYFVDASRADAPSYWGFVGPDEIRAAWADWLPRAPAQAQVQAHRGMAFGTLRSVAPTTPGGAALVIQDGPGPYLDILGINGVNETGRGVALAFPARFVLRPPGAALGRELAAFSTHLARAATMMLPHTDRLEPRVQGGVQRQDAGLDPGLGQLGLAALRELALRTVQEHEPLSAEATRIAWRDVGIRRLVAIDRFEANGRRFTIAVHARTDESRAAELTTRELEAAQLAAAGLSNKLIADRMGIGVSTVGTLLSRAATKLGTESRVALMRARPHLDRRRS